MPLRSKLTPAQGHNFTLSYIMKTSNDFSCTADSHQHLTKLNRIDPCVVPYQNCLNGSHCLHK